MKTQNITTLVALALFNYFSFVIPAPDTRIKADNPKIDPPAIINGEAENPTQIVILIDTSSSIDSRIDQAKTPLLDLNRPKTSRD